ncbi:GNAT family N-acetyltransferase [Phenylobacterium terrae]|uniref:GNAT family N-acetyltransferase n=1 Tax=Phenylobacterium terrae TaxID=2665495 RepID=A0ABW4MW41_9CAUL
MAETEAAGVRVRPATAADAPALGRLGALLVAVHHDYDPERFLAPDTATAEGYGRFLAGQLRRPEVVMLVAEAGGQVLGYSYAAIEGTDYMTLRGPAGALHDLLVDPAHRGRGVGRRLLEASIAALEARGAPRIVLSTAERNVGAQKLFAEAGFRRTMVEMTRELP